MKPLSTDNCSQVIVNNPMVRAAAAAAATETITSLYRRRSFSRRRCFQSRKGGDLH